MKETLKEKKTCVSLLDQTFIKNLSLSSLLQIFRSAVSQITIYLKLDKHLDFTESLMEELEIVCHYPGSLIRWILTHKGYISDPTFKRKLENFVLKNERSCALPRHLCLLSRFYHENYEQYFPQIIGKNPESITRFKNLMAFFKEEYDLSLPIKRSVQDIQRLMHIDGIPDATYRSNKPNFARGQEDEMMSQFKGAMKNNREAARKRLLNFIVSNEDYSILLWCKANKETLHKTKSEFKLQLIAFDEHGLAISEIVTKSVIFSLFIKKPYSPSSFKIYNAYPADVTILDMPPGFLGDEGCRNLGVIHVPTHVPIFHLIIRIFLIGYMIYEALENGYLTFKSEIVKVNLGMTALEVFLTSCFMWEIKYGSKSYWSLILIMQLIFSSPLVYLMDFMIWKRKSISYRIWLYLDERL